MITIVYHTAMQLAQIQGFLEVARHGNVSRAAESLGITQPALTARLQALESEIGQSLFVRTRRGARLTDAGHAFRPYAEQAVAALASGLDELGEIAGGAGGELALAVAPQVSTYVLPHLLARFAAERPGVRLAVRTAHSEEIVDLVVRREVHAGLGRQVRHPLVTYTPIYDDELVLVSKPGHPLSRSSHASRAALADAPLILFDRASSYYELTTALVREAGVRPRGVIELDNIEAAKRMVATGLGVALLPRTSVADELAAGTLAATRIVDAGTRPRHIGIIRRSDAGVPSPILDAFMAMALEVPENVPGAAAPASIDTDQSRTEGQTSMGDKGPGSKGGGKKPKTSTKKQKGAATK